MLVMKLRNYVISLLKRCVEENEQYQCAQKLLQEQEAVHTENITICAADSGSECALIQKLRDLDHKISVLSTKYSSANYSDQLLVLKRMIESEYPDVSWDYTRYGRLVNRVLEGFHDVSSQEWMAFAEQIITLSEIKRELEDGCKKINEAKSERAKIKKQLGIE